MIEEGFTCTGEPSVCAPVIVVEEGCATLTLNVNGEDPATVPLDSLPQTFSYSNGRTIVVSDIGG